MDKIVHLIMWVFVGALIVLIIKNATGFATAVSAVGGQITGDANLLAGNTTAGGSQTPPKK